MATDNSPQRSDVESEQLEIKASAYDRVSSLLVSLVMFVGFFVTLLLLIWGTTTLTWKRQMPVILFSEEFGDGEAPVVNEDKFEPPGVDEVDKLSDPQIEQTLAAVSNTISAAVASFNPILSAADSSTTGPTTERRRNGPRTENIVPRWERWEIHYASDKVDEYARQLDFFGIELGAAGGGAPQVDYASEFSGSMMKRSGPPSDENRLYMTWTSGTMKAMDRLLLNRAGIATNDRAIMQFYPQSTEDRIVVAELTYAMKNGVEHPRFIQKTIFSVEKSADGYEYKVLEQWYRTPSGL